jgi:hypothetical protein
MLARAALLVLLTGATHAYAEDFRFGADLRASGWETVSFPKIAPVVFSTNAGTLEIAADSAAGLLWHALTVPRRAPATAEWSWKVEQGVQPTDLTRRGEDDRTLAVYFVFGAAEEAAKGPMALLSASTVTCLVYVFGGSGPRSSLLSSPHMGERGKFIILRPADGPKRQWLQESVDLKADYVRAFRRLPGHLLAVAVSSDSDDTRGRTRAQLRGLRIDG